MYSAEGEEVPFTESMYPKGNVEDWLLNVEAVMRSSLKQIIKISLDDYVEVFTKATLPNFTWTVSNHLKGLDGLNCTDYPDKGNLKKLGVAVSTCLDYKSNNRTTLLLHY